MLSWFLFCAFVTLAPAAHAQDCTGPDGVIGDIIYNNTYDVFQGCSTLGWMAFHKPLDSPPDCPNIGDTCTSNGTVYAGIYEGHKYYITAADAPGTVVTGGTGSGTYTWNNGSNNRPDLNNASMPNCPSVASAPDPSNAACIGARGRDYTTYLANFAGSGSPYNAARYCYNLGKPSDPSGPNNPLAHGRDDWYLPAVDELKFIFESVSMWHIFDGLNYWSSTENSANFAWMVNFWNGNQAGYGKSTDAQRFVRCVAR